MFGFFEGFTLILLGLFASIIVGIALVAYVISVVLAVPFAACTVGSLAVVIAIWAWRVR